MWRKVQELGLSKVTLNVTVTQHSGYLTHLLAYLDPQKLEDSFVFDIMSDTPSELAVLRRLFAVYICIK